jgi:hypothetical protein
MLSPESSMVKTAPMKSVTSMTLSMRFKDVCAALETSSAIPLEIVPSRTAAAFISRSTRSPIEPSGINEGDNVEVDGLTT